MLPFAPPRSWLAPLLVGATTLLAFPADAWGTSDCTDFGVVATQPPDDRIVPRAAILRAFIDPLQCSGQPQLRVVCQGTTVAFTPSKTQPLEAPLPADAPPEGTRCSLAVWSVDDDLEVLSVDFTIGSDEAPPPPDPPTLASAELHHGGRADDGRAGPHRGLVVVEAGPDPLGMTLVNVVDSDGRVRGTAPVPPEGGSVVVRDVTVSGDGSAEACFQIETVNAVGASARADVCASSTSGPPEADGCSVGPSSPHGATTTIALVLAAIVASRRRAGDLAAS